MYSTENKINVMAEGELRNVCGEDVSVMRGSYDYYGPDGVKYTVDWYADETGDTRYKESHLKIIFFTRFSPERCTPPSASGAKPP